MAQKLKDRETHLQRLKADLQNCVGLIQEPKKLKESIMKIYARYVADGVKVEQSDVEGEFYRAFCRQREHMEKMVNGLKTRLARSGRQHDQAYDKIQKGPWAEKLMLAAMERGHWVFFQNCHLAPSWMPSLERLIENISPVKVHKDFRMWLTSLPSNKFPVSILQNGSKMTIEPPKGIKANLQKTYLRLTNEFFTSSTKASHLKALLLSLCLFHGISLERRKFGPLGFNIPYDFTDGDLNICISQVKMFLDEYQDVPYKVGGGELFCLYLTTC
ncbi:dynein heavy chain 1, axonemal-like [Trematomus bernacchii]|uniref:dynein heavy chain 1, axonemal-like n=1 Tax=Trematomus bernacchii TaxID=40690 RepID=UPI00146F4B8F|nr:dynein heavy chain 1, axonemal-like [Trematomus bernacchii]